MGRPTLFSDLPGSTDPFDQAYGPENANPISPYDLPTSTGAAFEYSLQGAMDLNPFPMAVRALRTFNEDWNSVFGDGERVSAADARKEVAERGLDLKIPDGGISRYELDNLQYFKQREIHRNQMLMGSSGLTGLSAQFAGGLAGTLVDPLNIASMFIPIVPEARVAAMLARQGASMAGRATVRAGVGAVEGAVGAAIIEPITYAGAQLQQADYDTTDSFINVMFGGVAGGGLHALGGVAYDYRGAKASRSIADFAAGLRRDAAARAPDEVHLQALQKSTLDLELDQPPRAASVFDSYEAQRRAASYNEDGSKKLFWIDEPPASTGPKDISLLDMMKDEETGGLTLRDLGALTARADTPVDAEDGFVYHATNVERAQEIANTGSLNPHDPGAFTEQDAWPDGATQPRIYFSGDPKVVGAFAPEEGESVIIRTVKPEDAKRESGTGDIVAEKPVPADRLEILGADGKWHPIKDVFKASDEYTRGIDAAAEKAALRNTPEARKNDDEWALDAERDGAEFDEQASQLEIPDEQRIAEEAEAFAAHVKSLRDRGLTTEDMEDMIKAGEEEAAMLEEEAAAWDAAIICETEA